MTEWLSGLSYQTWGVIGSAVAIAIVAVIKKDAAGKNHALTILKRLVGLGCIGLCVAGLSGCAQDRERAVTDMAQAVFLKIVDKAKLDQSNLAANGRIINPSYEVDGFVGIGGYFTGKVRANGVEVNATVMAGGSGEAELDQDLRDKLYRIIADPQISRERKREMIYNVLTDVGATTREVVLRATDQILGPAPAEPVGPPAPTTQPAEPVEAVTPTTQPPDG